MAQILADLGHGNTRLGHMYSTGVPKDRWRHVDQTCGLDCRVEATRDALERFSGPLDDMIGKSGFTPCDKRVMKARIDRHNSTAFPRTSGGFAQIDLTSFKVNTVPGQLEYGCHPRGNRQHQQDRQSDMRLCRSGQELLKLTSGQISILGSGL